MPSTQSGVSRARAPRSVVEQVTDYVVEMILAGELAPGQPLPINELALQLGVSHIPVREALRRLERDGLIQYTRGKGAQVAQVSVEDLHDVYRLRTAIELDVARRSFSHVGELERERADGALAEMSDALRSAHPTRFSPAHRAFHYALLPAASPWDRRILDQVWTATERYVQLYLSTVRVDPVGIDRVVAHHRRLIDASATGARGFTSAIREHIAWSERETEPGVRKWCESPSGPISLGRSAQSL